MKSFPKKSDGSKGTAEAGGRVEKGDFLVAVNSIRLEGFAFADAIRVLTSQVCAASPWFSLLLFVLCLVPPPPPSDVLWLSLGRFVCVYFGAFLVFLYQSSFFAVV